jgi:hypothetical protein
MIAMDMFDTDFYVLEFEITPATKAVEEHESLPRQGNMLI